MVVESEAVVPDFALGQSKRWRSEWMRALSSFGLAQVVGMLVAVVRIPLVIDAVGVAQFGILSLFLAALPWLGLFAFSSRASLRIVVAERGGDITYLSPEVIGAGRVSRQAGRAFLAIGVAFGTTVWLVDGAEVASSLTSYLLGGAVCVIAAATIGAGSSVLGLWEAQGKVGRVNFATAGASVAGFLLILMGVWLGAPFVVYVIAFIIPVYGAYWLAAMAHVPKLLLDRGHGLRRRRIAGDPASEQLSKKMLRITAVQQLQNGVDPFIIGVALGPIAVAQYSIVNRLAAVLVMLPTALQPLFVRSYAQTRASAGEEDIRNRQLLHSSYLAGVTLALGAIFTLSGDFVVHLFTAGNVSVPTALFVVVSLQAALFAWQVPTFAALGGAKGTQLVSRVMPWVVSLNLAASVALAHFGVWVPTTVSVVVGVGLHGYLGWHLGRHPELFRGTHK